MRPVLIEYFDQRVDHGAAALRGRTQAGDLDARARNLLRLHHLGGATLEQLAAMYGVHRATAVRWLADARAALARGTRRRLTASLDVSPAELDSILAMIGSRLEASVGRLLADDGEPG